MKKIRAVGSRMIIDSQSYNLDNFNRIVVVGAGKATASMAQAIEEIFEDRIDEGMIIVKYGHTGPLVSPIDGITLKDKQAVTEMLLKAGATIDELNAVRKHISNVKGGRLAEMAHLAILITLILSDVIGDRLNVIASGPTVPDSATFRDAIGVLRKYRIEDKIPVRVAKILKDGFEGRLKETPKGGEDFFKKTQTVIVAGINEALDAAKKKAESMGLATEIVTSELQGEAKGAASHLAFRAISEKNAMKSGDKTRCLLSGGETIVTVKGGGLGGRNQELALAFAIEIEGNSGTTLLSAGTDGTDGPTDAAGAIVDGGTLSLAKRYDIGAASYLENNDSYHFFKRLDSLSSERHYLMTGPTGTNVMDLQIISVEGEFVQPDG